MAEVQAENRRLVEPLQKAQEQVQELQRQLFSYEKDKALLAVSDYNILYIRVSKNLFSRLIVYLKSQQELVSRT
jgi:hypothetical protein